METRTGVPAGGIAKRKRPGRGGRKILTLKNASREPKPTCCAHASGGLENPKPAPET
jgi:hypothetical protein